MNPNEMTTHELLEMSRAELEAAQKCINKANALLDEVDDAYIETMRLVAKMVKEGKLDG